MDSNDLFIFIDESGNFDFTSSGTSHFVLGGVATLSPTASAKELLTLKYRLLKEGNDISEFHASEDRQFIRNQVFPVINLGNPKARIKENKYSLQYLLSSNEY